MTWTVRRLRAVLAAAGALLLSPVIGMVGSVAAELRKVHSGHLCLARHASVFKFRCPLRGGACDFDLACTLC